MKNPYPRHIELQYEKFFIAAFLDFAKTLEGTILQRIKAEEKAAEAVTDRSLADAPGDLLSFIEDLKAHYGKRISADTLQAKVAAHYNLLDEWSRARTTEAMSSLYSRLNSPQSPSVTGRPTPSGSPGELWLQTVDLRRNINADLIQQTIASNVGLIRTVRSDYLDRVYTAVHDGVTGGRSLKTIADEIMDQTGVHRNKAKFWARDQVSKFFGEATKQRQVQAGIKGYIWRTVPGARDSHSALEGTYQEWSKPPQIYRNGKGGLSLVRVHPGEDFNCRCFAEPATGPEMGERNYRGPGSFSEELQPGYFSERAQSAPVQWSGTGGLRERMAVDIQDPVLRRSVDDAVRTVDRVMTIPTGSTRALSVTQLKPGDVLYNAPVNGYYLRGHVSLQAQNPFQRMTAIHELYHWVHKKLLPESAKGPLQSVMNAIHRTSSYTTLQRKLKLIKDPELKKEFTRYVSDSEQFSRAMEQYIARASTDPSIINEFNAKRNAMNYGYWVDDEFDDVYIVLEKLFRNMGWQK